MTILPTKRAVNSNNNDEASESNNQNNSKERNSRHRDEHNVANETATTTNRRPFQYNNNTTERKDRTLQKRYKETPIDTPRERRERERQKQRELRRKRKHEHQTKRANKTEIQESDVSATGDSEDAGPSNAVVEKKESSYADEDGSGCNSEDEYNSRRPLTVSSPTDEEWARVSII